jgi:hypothetical protein
MLLLERIERFPRSPFYVLVMRRIEHAAAASGPQSVG